MLYWTVDFFKETRPNIFNGGSGGSKPKFNYGWYALIIEVAQTGVCGKVNEVERTNVHDWMNALAITRANKEVTK